MTRSRIQSRISDYQAELTFLVMNKISQVVPLDGIELSSLNLPEHIPLAVPTFYRSSDIDGLIGAQLFWDLLREGGVVSADQTLQLRNTELGWIVTGEQQEKKQYLQGVQLTAMESPSEMALESSSKLNEANDNNETNETRNKCNATSKKEDGLATETLKKVNENSKNKSNNENISVNANACEQVATMTRIGNARVNANEQCSDVDMGTFGDMKNTNGGINFNVNRNPAKMDVYTFFNDPPVVPVGDVKGKRVTFVDTSFSIILYYSPHF
ncbi:uncharacterized protein LOC117216468 [Bombus bifarius]|uniref:Uncharacterized protein LOC117216468 n=1 Tax=Bombus bifarius TaxID=103933 RepID=A0A6P8MYV2_9HYME|nr:uncharacterized protein LOC117216468 [Bombus bifarius]